MDTFGSDLAEIKKIFPFVDDKDMLLTLLELQKDVARIEIGELPKSDAKCVLVLNEQIEAAVWDESLWESTLEEIQKTDIYHFFKNRDTFEIDTSRLDFS